MGFLYRILGFVAKSSEGMSRQRVNGLGLNWWIMLGIGMFTAFASYAVYESARNRAGARDVTVAQAVTDRDLLDAYVRVTGGHFDAEGALSQGGGDGDDDAKPRGGSVWVPLVDAGGKHAMFVQLNEKLPPGEMSREAIRGMLRTLDRQLKDHVAAQGIKAEGIAIDRGVMLVAGERPARLWLWLTLASLGALAILMMLWAALTRYVVFRAGPTPGLPAEVPAVDPASIDLRASGKFRLSDKVQQRFLDMPVMVAEMESGDRGLLANVNASVSMYGHVAENREGMWGLLIKSGTLEAPRYGQLYASFESRPAMRLRFVDAATGKHSSAVLSFATVEARDAVRAALYAPAATEPGDAAQDA